MKVKTIDVTAFEWFDKVNGNSYFAGSVTVNFGMKSEKTIYMPFQYGYGSQYEFEALATLKKAKIVNTDKISLWSFCADNNIILRRNMTENCKQRDLKRIGNLAELSKN